MSTLHSNWNIQRIPVGIFDPAQEQQSFTPCGEGWCWLHWQAIQGVMTKKNGLLWLKTMGGSINGGTPIAGWFPISGNLHIVFTLVLVVCILAAQNYCCTNRAWNGEEIAWIRVSKSSLLLYQQKMDFCSAYPCAPCIEKFGTVYKHPPWTWLSHVAKHSSAMEHMSYVWSKTRGFGEKYNMSPNLQPPRFCWTKPK